MKKMMLLGVLLLSAAAGVAQESRQDFSFSGTGFFGPQVNSPNAVTMNSTGSLGLLASYRYMLTPHSSLELNYGFTQNQQKYQANFTNLERVHSREQEGSGAYVYSWNFKRFSPFAQVGVGAIFFTPIHDYKTTVFDTKQNVGIGALFGAGVAYELSPSWDIRVEYRGFLLKAPSYSLPNLGLNKYEILSLPAVGFAYHF
jgi:opacity protein-like surface antigen